MIRSLYAAPLLLPLLAVAAQAQDLAACRAIRAPSDRLACYDHATLPAPAKPAPAPVAQSAAPAPAQAVLPPANLGPLTWSGTGLVSTPTFEVAGPWKIRWSSSGSILLVNAYEPGGALTRPGKVQDGPGDGSLSLAKGGTFYLVITGDGPWRVWVEPS